MAKAIFSILQLENFTLMRYFSLLFFSIIFLSNVQAQGIEFFHGTWAEALEKAKEEEKPLFVDCYTTWCGPCKRMAKMIFTQEAVGDAFNDNYINVKLDMETKDGRKFGSKYPVSAYPTLYFIDTKGEVLHKVKGGQQAEPLIQMANHVLGKVDYSADFAKAYEEGKREPELIYNYVKALNKSNKNSIKISNEYLKTQKDLSTDFNQKFIFEAAAEADSRIFDLLIKNRKNIEKLVGAEEVEAKIEKACQRTADKAIEFESEMLLEEAQTKMNEHLPTKSKEFLVMTNLDYHQSLGNSEEYRKCCKDYVKKQIGKDAKELNALANSMIKSFSHDGEAMKDAEKYAKKAADADAKNYRYLMTYASILKNNGKKGEAVKAAQKALTLIGDNKGMKMSIEQFIQKVKQS